MTANELADELQKMFVGKEYDRLVHEIPDLLRQQQYEIEDLKNANRFIQNFAEEQHKRAVALEMRELTDEEIEEVEKLCKKPLASWAWQVEFARAIEERHGIK